MQVFGQYHPAMNRKRVTLPYRLDHGAQQFDVASQQIIALPLQQVDGEKVSSARMPGATVIRHGGSIAEETIRRCQFLKLEEFRELPTFGAMPVGYCALRLLRYIPIHIEPPPRFAHKAAGFMQAADSTMGIYWNCKA